MIADIRKIPQQDIGNYLGLCITKRQSTGLIGSRPSDMAQTALGSRLHGLQRLKEDQARPSPAKSSEAESP